MLRSGNSTFGVGAEHLRLTPQLADVLATIWPCPEAGFPPLRAYGLSRVVHWQPERSRVACSEAVIFGPEIHLPMTFDRYSAFFFGGVFGMPAVQPPSITADVPVTNDESSEAR